MIEFQTNYSYLEVNNPNFDLIYVESIIVNRDIDQIDCTRLIEREVRKGFLNRFNLELNLSVKDIHWFTQKNMKTFEALVIVMTK